MATPIVITIEDAFSLTDNGITKVVRIYEGKDRGFGKPFWPSASQKARIAFAAKSEGEAREQIVMWIKLGCPMSREDMDTAIETQGDH